MRYFSVRCKSIGSAKALPNHVQGHQGDGYAEYLAQYQNFSYEAPHPAEYTTLPGILQGFCQFTAIGWIQTGVLLLILTPILRVLLSFFDFVKERDWLYAAITAAVLAVIISNSLSL